MKFYKSLKPIKWGFKVLCKVDLETNYLYNLFFDPSKMQNEIITLTIVIIRHKILFFILSKN